MKAIVTQLMNALSKTYGVELWLDRMERRDGKTTPVVAGYHEPSIPEEFDEWCNPDYSDIEIFDYDYDNGYGALAKKLTEMCAALGITITDNSKQVKKTTYTTHQDVMTAYHNGDITKRSAAAYKANITRRLAA